MNFLGNFFGGRGNRGDNDCCSIIWLLLLLSSCGGCFNICDIFNNDCFCIIILLLLLCSCGNDNCGTCRG